MMDNEVKVYYLKGGTLTDENKKKISESMKRHYATHKMTAEHKHKISLSMKKVWRYWKECWRKDGLI